MEEEEDVFLCLLTPNSHLCDEGSVLQADFVVKVLAAVVGVSEEHLSV